MGADEVVGKGIGCAEAGVDGGDGGGVEAFFAGVADDAANLAFGGEIVVGGGCDVVAKSGTVEVETGEGAIDEDVGGRTASSARFALEEGDAGGIEVAPGDPAIVGEDFAVGIEAAVETNST